MVTAAFRETHQAQTDLFGSGAPAQPEKTARHRVQTQALHREGKRFGPVLLRGHVGEGTLLRADRIASGPVQREQQRSHGAQAEDPRLRSLYAYIADPLPRDAERERGTEIIPVARLAEKALKTDAADVLAKIEILGGDVIREEKRAGPFAFVRAAEKDRPGLPVSERAFQREALRGCQERSRGHDGSALTAFRQILGTAQDVVISGVHSLLISPLRTCSIRNSAP